MSTSREESPHVHAAAAPASALLARRRGAVASSGAGGPTSERSLAAHSPARSNLPPHGWLEPYVWLEVYAWLYYLVLTGVLLFSAIPYLRSLDIVLWYAWQALFPVGFASVAFSLGPPPHVMARLHTPKHKIRLAYSFVTGVLAAASGLAFVTVKLAYAFSDECASDAQSFCQSGRRGTFAFLIVMCAVLAALSLASVAAVVFGCWGPAAAAPYVAAGVAVGPEGSLAAMPTPVVAHPDLPVVCIVPRPAQLHHHHKQQQASNRPVGQGTSGYQAV